MIIRKATKEDLNDILAIYEHARTYMREHNNPNQWGKIYPYKKYIVSDIGKGEFYVALDNNEIVGCYKFIIGNDPTYDVIDGKWLNDSKYAVIHRLASKYNDKGIGSFIIKYCIGIYPHIRIDTHNDNLPMQNLLYKLNFKKTGVIYVRGGSPRVAFEYYEK